MDDKNALDRVMSFRNHPVPLVRVNVLQYLSRLHSEQAFSILIEALRDQYPFVREMAADELASLGHAEAIPLLQQLLADPDVHVRESAQNAIEVLKCDLGLEDA